MEPVQEIKSSGATGAGPLPPVASVVPQKPAGNVAAGTGAKESVAAFGGNPTGRQPQSGFRFPVNTPEGQKERREADAERKRLRRQANAAAALPPPLPSASVVDSPQAPDGEQGPVPSAPVAPVALETFVPWVAEDVSDFTDELVELAEVKRVSEFVELARDAKMPAKFIAEVEKRSHYPTHSKNALKRCLADCAAKWLNKAGVSSKSKEEVKLLFCMVTIKLQGVRLKKDLLAMIEADKAKREPEKKPEASQPALSIAK